MSFQPDSLLAALTLVSPPARLRVALSGGVDSVVLLHALKTLRDSGQLAYALDAIHINHGINPHADAWQEFCNELCAGWDLPLHTERLQLDRNVAGLEQRAREARYEIFARALSPADWLLLAHHLDDQLETLMLRLLRGAGSAGMAGMPAMRTLGDGRLLRPLLTFRREELLDYARVQQLRWVEDDSNLDQGFDRNFIRHQVLPLLAQRWPDYRERMGKSAQLWQESDQLLDVLAQQDLAPLQGTVPGRLQLDALLTWDSARQRNALRFWLQSLGIAPGWHLLQRLVSEIITAREDAPASLDCPGARLQRYRGHLYALKADAGWHGDPVTWVAPSRSLPLPDNGILCLAPGGDAVPPGRLEVRYRVGGESLRLAGRPSKPLKQWFQEGQVEPWLRGRVPLLFADGQLAMVAGLGVNQDGPWAGLVPSPTLVWERPNLLLG